MSVTIKHKRGIYSNLTTNTLQTGELGFATDTNQVFIGDTSNPTNPILIGRVSIGLNASKGSAGTSGQFYYATDTKILYIDDGSSWQIFKDNFSQEITQYTPDSTNPPTNTNIGVLRAISFSGSSDNITFAQFTTTNSINTNSDINFEIMYSMSSSESSKSVSFNADIYIFSDGDSPTKSADVTGLEDEISVPNDQTTDKIALTNIKVPTAQLSGIGQNIVVKLWRDINGVTSNHTGNFQMFSLRAYQ